MISIKEVLKQKIADGEASEEEKDHELNRSFKDLMKDLLPTLKRCMTNKALVFLLVGESLNDIFLASLTYDTKLFARLFM